MITRQQRREIQDAVDQYGSARVAQALALGRVMRQGHSTEETDRLIDDLPETAKLTEAYLRLWNLLHAATDYSLTPTHT